MPKPSSKLHRAIRKLFNGMPNAPYTISWTRSHMTYEEDGDPGMVLIESEMLMGPFERIVQRDEISYVDREGRRMPIEAKLRQRAVERVGKALSSRGIRWKVDFIP